MTEEKFIPTELNLEVSPSYLGNQRGRFMRNWDFVQTGSDKNTLQLKNLQAVEIYDPTFVLPSGTNRRVGGIVSRETNEEYSLIHNSAGNHCIYRVKNGKCQMVYQSPLLNFLLDPQY